MSNILSEVHPELVTEWSDKNLPLTPDRITYGSNKVVWWKGACGHEWQTSVKARSNGENCPICSGARVIEGINDLATLKPELADEWSSKNDPLKPTMVTTGSHKKVIWQDTADRTHLRNEIRKVDISDERLSAAKMKISAISERLKELRKEVKLCDGIAKRSGVIADTLSQVKAEEEKSQRKESRNYEQRR